MVKNTKGGNKKKKQKRGYQKKTALNNTESGQMFGQIIENRGDHFAVLCADNVTRMGKLSGAAKRGQRLISGSFVIISIRDYETDQKNCDIIAAGNPPSDIRIIFRKINPIVGDDSNIEFYTQDDKFKEFEESEATIGEVIINNNVSELSADKESKFTDVFVDDEIRKDYDARKKDFFKKSLINETKNDDSNINEEIDWNDL
jgi:translation initiation factor IF-1